jgi:hypothetical protein
MFGSTNVWVDECLGQQMFGLMTLWVNKFLQHRKLRLKLIHKIGPAGRVSTFRASRAVQGHLLEGAEAGGLLATDPEDLGRQEGSDQAVRPRRPQKRPGAAGSHFYNSISAENFWDYF